MRFIFDSNILLSAIIKQESVPGKALEKAIQNGTLCFSDKTRNEISEVVSRDKFDRYISKSERIARLEQLFVHSCFMLPATTEPITICRDPKDNAFLELAVSANVACIVSGDLDLLVLHPFRTIPILTASQFLDSTF